jgi:hypothetical protein
MEVKRASVFISYATPDRERIVPFYNFLSAEGFDVWMDFHRLKPGQVWDYEIKRALEKASIVVVFVSNNSVDRRGYAQREIKLALDRAFEKLGDDIYIIPVILDEEVAIPEQLRDVQVTKITQEGWEKEVADAIRHQLARLGTDVELAQELSNVRWHSTVYKDRWDGLPGYEVEFKLLHFSSEEYPNISEITDIIRGELLSEVMGFRKVKFEIEPDRFSYGQHRLRRTNSYDAHSGDPAVVGKMLSVSYGIYTYFAGAAHPNHGFKTFTFLLDPLIRVDKLDELFTDPSAALALIQAEVRKQLLNPPEAEENEDSRLDKEWVLKGTQTWEQFDAFALTEDGISLVFAPYAVAPYAYGPQTAKIPYPLVVDLLKREFAHALELNW